MGGFNIGASASLEPLDTIDDYQLNTALLQRYNNSFGWHVDYGVLSKLRLYSGTSTTGTAGIMQIDFCNENDEVKRTLYSTSRGDILPILGEMYIGIQSYLLHIVNL